MGLCNVLAKAIVKFFEERIDVIFTARCIHYVYYYSLSIGTFKCLHHFKVRTVIHVMTDL
ncbi:hypothetical protein [Bacillus cereus group sp. BY105LC]|uniref:hypothetical protein n=1 Tax=Bacillus cereus group sp. BY105LC TaxID=3018088 RepID=UPI0022E306B0|nr:hypothetical protein [Bacillus cereus group sp. BY105LC]MDA1883432.1 hypothetical protein [Bacillus cereus group sp. BY105LC]